MVTNEKKNCANIYPCIDAVAVEAETGGVGKHSGEHGRKQ